MRAEPAQYVVVLAAGALLGCSLDLDPKFGKPDLADSATDASWHDDASEPDAEADQDAGEPEQDAGRPCGPGQRCPEGEYCPRDHLCKRRCTDEHGCADLPCQANEDCDLGQEYCAPGLVCAARCQDGVGCVGSMCERDRDCPNRGADQYCTKAHSCSALCSEELGCVGPDVNDLSGPFANSNRAEGPLVSDGKQVYFSTWELWNRSNGTGRRIIWAWDLEHSAVAILEPKSSVRLLFAHDGFVYLLIRGDSDAFPRELWRLPSDGAAPAERIATTVTAAWLADGQLWWSRAAEEAIGGPRSELWHTPDSGPLAPERVADAEHEGWLAGNSSSVFRASAPGLNVEVLSEPLPALSPSQAVTTFHGYGSTLSVDERAVFQTGFEARGLTRVPFDDSRDSLALAPSYLRIESFFVLGDWIYWSATSDAKTGEASIQRSHRDLSIPAQELMRGDLDPTFFGVASSSLVFFDGIHFFAKPLLPLPCSDSLPCPSDQTCRSEGLCE